MPILKNATTPNGATLSYHRAIRLSVDLLNDTAVATVISHVDESAYADGLPHAWNWEIAIPVALLSGPDVAGAVESALIAPTDSPFYQGGIVSDESQSLDAAKARKLASLKSACRMQIVAGFQSDALGVAHLYPAKDLDQTNLVGTVVASLIAGADAAWVTPFWCADAEGAWVFEMHTAGQIQQVGIASKASILAALSKNEALASTVASATTIEQVEAVTWS
jgi:hypothetical protein